MVTTQLTAIRVRHTGNSLYRTESHRTVTTLLHLLGDFDLAEQALNKAFRAVLDQWARDGGGFSHHLSKRPGQLVSKPPAVSLDAVRRSDARLAVALRSRFFSVEKPEMTAFERIVNDAVESWS